MPKYECHVTYNYPEEQSALTLFHSIGKALGWSTSFIDGDPLLGEKRFFYFTCHGISKASLHIKMRFLEAAVKEFAIRRKKIEKIVFDQRF